MSTDELTQATSRVRRMFPARLSIRTCILILLSHDILAPLTGREQTVRAIATSHRGCWRVWNSRLMNVRCVPMDGSCPNRYTVIVVPLSRVRLDVVDRGE